MGNFMFICRKNATFDESFQSAGQASDAASQHGLRAKPSKLKLETAGKKHIASTKDGGRVKSVDQGEESRSAAMKCRFGPDRSEMLTTDKLYYSAASHSVPDPDQLDGADVSGSSFKMWLIFVGLHRVRAMRTVATDVPVS